MNKLLSICAIALFLLPNTLNAQQKTPEEILSATTWITTKAVNNKGEDISATFRGPFGMSGYTLDGRYTLATMEGNISARFDSGTYVITNNTRILNNKNIEQAVRVVPIITLTPQEFTYRIDRSAVDGAGAYIDVYHAPTKKKLFWK